MALHRCAQLMRHVGQEFGLCTIGLLSCILGGGQLSRTLGHQMLQLVAVDAQVFLRLAKLSDVQMSSQQSQRSALGVALDLRTRQNVTPAAILVPHPILGLEQQRVRCGAGAQRSDGALLVLGMEQRLPRRETVGHFSFGVTELRLVLFGQHDGIGSDFPGPQPELGSPDSSAQRSLGFSALG